MKSQLQKYSEAVSRNLSTLRTKQHEISEIIAKNDLAWLRIRSGIRSTDESFDPVLVPIRDAAIQKHSAKKIPKPLVEPAAPKLKTPLSPFKVAKASK